MLEAVTPPQNDEPACTFRMPNHILDAELDQLFTIIVRAVQCVIVVRAKTTRRLHARAFGIVVQQQKTSVVAAAGNSVNFDRPGATWLLLYTAVLYSC